MKWSSLRELLNSQVSDDEDIKKLYFRDSNIWNISIRFFKKTFEFHIPRYSFIKREVVNDKKEKETTEQVS